MSILLDHPMVTCEQWENFSVTDHQTWNILFDRQAQLLQNCAANEIITGMQTLAITKHQIPKFSELNRILEKSTGFSLVPVKGYIPEDLFFAFLAERQFPTTCFIRTHEQLDYLEEPDIFHDVFGHVPLLVNPIFADFMQQFGLKGLEAIKKDMLAFAATLYWFTVEFGLINTKDGLRIYGAGITSSKSESVYSLQSATPKRLAFNLSRIMKTKYHIDSLQKTYFVIESFQQLFDALNNLNWEEIKNDNNLFIKR